MKKLIAFLCVICITLGLVACSSNGVKIDKKQSFFSDFKVENEKVYIYCTLFIENLQDSQKTVELKATFEDDAKNGLLKNASLYGYATDKSTKNFKLHSGENKIEVVFIGDFAGTNKKQDRLLPDIEIIEIE